MNFSLGGLEIQVENLNQVSAAISHIPGAVEKAVKASIKKTLRQSEKVAVTAVKNRYTLPINLFKSSLRKNISDNTGELRAEGHSFPLYYFKHSPTYRINSRGKYIKAVVVKGQGGILKRAFKMSDRPVLFEREGDARLPIKKMFSLTPAEMFNSPPIRDKVISQTQHFLETNFIQEVNKFL